jgi:membrane-bound inhibitor of C-type lysozyme
MKKNFLFVFVFLFALILISTAIWLAGADKKTAQKDVSQKFVAEAYYQCDSAKQLKARYFKGPTATVTPGEPPSPSGLVELTLNDGALLLLPQTLSGSGIRYASPNEKIIFWSKGENAFVTENEKETYSDCTERIWSLENEQQDLAVRDFLLSREELSWKTGTESKNFCIFQNLAPEKALFPVYLWVRCSEYKMVDGELKEMSGTSVPVKIDYPNELSYYDRNKFSLSIPGDGSAYDKDVKKIFPEEIWDRLHFESRPLNEKIKEAALKYFNKTN